jgi:hypothetical protein
MKEAEKEAEKIIEMFLNVKSNKINDHSKIEYPTAKQCAIIYVEGIIKAVDKREQYIEFCLSDSHGFPIEDDFWQQVKQAIQKA